MNAPSVSSVDSSFNGAGGDPSAAGLIDSTTAGCELRRPHKPCTGRAAGAIRARRLQCPGTRVWTALAGALWLLAPQPTSAQALPTEPLTFAGGRLVLSGEASAAVGPEDTGYFNYTDYEQSALRLMRLGVSSSLFLGDRVELLSAARTETGKRFEMYAMFVRVRPWGNRPIDLQVGRIPPAFGSFSRRGYGIDNPLIGYPLSYQYLTSLRSDALPANADDLLRMRGRGWRVAFPIGDQTPKPGLPLMSAVRWDTGVQVRIGTRPVQVVAAVTNGSLSNPLVRDDNAGKQILGRFVYQPSAGFVLGVSAGRAAYLSRAATDLVTARNEGGFTQRAVGADIEYSREHWLVRAESLLSWWTVPAIDRPSIDSPLGAVSVFVEGQYKLGAGYYVAGRVDHLGFSEISGTLARGQSVPWDFPATRIEVGGGYYIVRNVIAKVAYQHNWRTNPFNARTRFLAGQILYWF